MAWDLFAFRISDGPGPGSPKVLPSGKALMRFTPTPPPGPWPRFSRGVVNPRRGNGFPTCMRGVDARVNLMIYRAHHAEGVRPRISSYTRDIGPLVERSPSYRHCLQAYLSFELHCGARNDASLFLFLPKRTRGTGPPARWASERAVLVRWKDREQNSSRLTLGI